MINVTQPGKYSYEATVSSEVNNSSFGMTLIDGDGNEKTLGSVSVPNTGNKDIYQTQTGKIRNSIKKEGIQKLRVTIKAGSCNIDNIKFVCTEPASGINEVMTSDDSDAPTYNLMGVPVGAGYRGIVIKNGKKMLVK